MILRLCKILFLWLFLLFFRFCLFFRKTVLEIVSPVLPFRLLHGAIERLQVVAEQAISFDLDDGVVVNYAKFGDILQKIK